MNRSIWDTNPWGPTEEEINQALTPEERERIRQIVEEAHEKFGSILPPGMTVEPGWLPTSHSEEKD